MALSAAPALAGTCDFDSSQPLKAMQVSAAKSAFVSKDGKASKAYVRRGDEVVVMDGQDKLVCAAYISPKGVETDGWLKVADLKSATAPANATALMGEWADANNSRCAGSTVKIAKGKTPDTVALDGEALWSSTDSKDCAPNSGELDSGDLKLEQGMLRYDNKESDPHCAVDFTPLGTRYLRGDDQNATGCWGFNVSFSGLYFKKH